MDERLARDRYRTGERIFEDEGGGQGQTNDGGQGYDED